MIELTEIENNLTTQEADRFDDLEICIANGLQTFVEVGNALAEIRDGKLYRVHYGTFEDYCQKRWGMSRIHAHRLMTSADVVSNLLPIGNIPLTESQARPLTSLTPDQQREIWETAVNTAPNGKVTAAHVEATKRDYLAPAIDYDETETSTGYFEDDYENHYLVESDDYLPIDTTPMSQTPGIMSSGGSNGVEMTTGNGRDISALMSSASDEWYTTPDIIEAVTAVLGLINLDPASCEVANETVKAAAYFTKEDDGLNEEWWGSVYLNPPYGNEIPKWVDKVVTEYETGNIDEAILLLPSRTDTRWFRALREYPRCFMHGRVKFNGHDNSAPFPTMLVGVGVDIERFTEVMESLGDVYEWHTNLKSS